MFFSDWHALLRILIVGTLAYSGLVLLLRASGKRTLSKMNAFDFIVTVALGSTLATVLLSRDVALLDGLTALALLVLLQYAVAWLSVHSGSFGHLVKSKPKLIYFRGEFLAGPMRRERVTEGEVLAAIRSEGLAALSEAEAVVLETDGTFSVLRRPATPATPTALRRVSGAEGIPETSDSAAR